MKSLVTGATGFIGKRTVGSIPFRLAWSLGWVLEKLLNPLQIRSPLTRLNAAILGRDNAVDTTLARKDLGWKTTVSYQDAMASIGAWVRDRYRVN